jgi:hypothetical protein
MLTCGSFLMLARGPGVSGSLLNGQGGRRIEPLREPHVEVRLAARGIVILTA